MQLDGHTKRSAWRVKLALLAATALFTAAGCSVSNQSDKGKPDIQIVDDGPAFIQQHLLHFRCEKSILSGFHMSIIIGGSSKGLRDLFIPSWITAIRLIPATNCRRK
jgi:hypothetical protein